MLPPPPRITTSAELTAHFRAFVRAVNTRMVSGMTAFVAPRIELNGKRMTPQAFTALIVPGAVFSPAMIVADVGKRTLAVRMEIEIPAGSIKHVNLAGATVELSPGCGLVTEHCFYHFNEHWLIDQVWSVYSYGDSPPVLGREAATAAVTVVVGPGAAAAGWASANGSPTAVTAALPLKTAYARCSSCSTCSSSSSPPSSSSASSTSPSTKTTALSSRPPHANPPPSALNCNGKGFEEQKAAAKVAIKRVKEARQRQANQRQQQQMSAMSAIV